MGPVGLPGKPGAPGPAGFPGQQGLTVRCSALIPSLIAPRGIPKFSHPSPCRLQGQVGLYGEAGDQGAAGPTGPEGDRGRRGKPGEDSLDIFFWLELWSARFGFIHCFHMCICTLLTRGRGGDARHPCLSATAYSGARLSARSTHCPTDVNMARHSTPTKLHVPFAVPFIILALADRVDFLLQGLPGIPGIPGIAGAQGQSGKRSVPPPSKLKHQP